MPADAGVIREKVAKHDWTLRANDDHRQLVVGNALNGVRVDAGLVTGNGYRRVYVYGNVNACLWLVTAAGQLGPVSGQRPRHSCSTFTGMTPDRYARRVNCLPGPARAGDPAGTKYGALPGTNKCTDGSSARVNTRLSGCSRVGAYGNVLPWQNRTEAHDRYGVIVKTYAGLKWRYITRDGRFVMVRDTHRNDPRLTKQRAGHTKWFFVRSTCVEEHTSHGWRPLIRR
ncbi:hypothetical protein [Paractinoplanes globisporus]|uniref:Uncharacterized protein n=1 Tax=Paractinoplanes globisporus TaxID=113565 RepID=A0ABW6WT66_9ACTN|nr:hypothetical protein [Actinoplanes globisporus]